MRLELPNDTAFRKDMPVGTQGRTESSQLRENDGFVQVRMDYIHNQLKDKGLHVHDFVRLSEAKTYYQAAYSRLVGGDMSVEADCERWGAVLRSHPEYREEMERAAREWERAESEENVRALRETRGFVPPNVSEMSVFDITAAGLPRPLARRVIEKQALWLTRMHVQDIAQVHHADLQNKFVLQGLDLVETRAVFAAVPEVFANDPEGKKAAWRKALRDKLEGLTKRQLAPHEARHASYRGAERVFTDSPQLRRVSVKSAAFDSTPRPDASSLGPGVHERAAALAEARVEATFKTSTEGEADGRKAASGAVSRALAGGLAEQLART